MKPDHWYELLMAVGTDQELFMYLWDAEDPTINASHWWFFDGWGADDWKFDIGLGYGKVDVDYFSHQSFVIMPELSDAEYAFWEGHKLAVLDDAFNEAFDLFSSAITMDPACAACYRRRGIINYFVYENKLSGLEDFNAAVNLEPDNWMGHRLLYYGYLADDLETARTYAQKVIDLAPDLPNGYYYLGQTYIDEGDFDSAVEAYVNALEIEPANHEYLWKLCIGQNGQRDFQGAYVACSKCLEISPWLNTCYFDRAVASDELGDTSSAKDDFQTYLDLTPLDDCPECQQIAQDYIDQH